MPYKMPFRPGRTISDRAVLIPASILLALIIGVVVFIVVAQVRFAPDDLGASITVVDVSHF